MPKVREAVKPACALGAQAGPGYLLGMTPCVSSHVDNALDANAGSGYSPVRALGRGLQLLQALNRLGGARPADLAAAAALDRTTTYRMLATLEDLGFVARGPNGDDYVLTSEVKTLSEGFTARDRTTQIVAAHLGALFQKVVWPTDFATFDRGKMVIRETTHRFSPYSVHRAMVGQARPLLTSALGRAAFAGADDAERRRMLEIYAGENPLEADPGRLRTRAEKMLQDFRQRGYSWSVGGSGGKISAIGMPVHRHLGPPAAINLVFFRTAMSVETAAKRFQHDLKACAEQIEASLNSENLA